MSSNPLFDMSPYQSRKSMSYTPDWRDATYSDPAWDEFELHPELELDTTKPDGDAQSNSTNAPTMAEDKTPSSSHTPVEVVEELSPEEEADRQRLELKVERAWDEAARALRELRDRRLYRSKYKTFEEYCRDRFGFTRQSANFKIAAADVMENLTTFSCQILPTKETQVRPLTKLKPDEQPQVWSEAVKHNGGKVPSERVVKDAVLRHQAIVERLKQKNPLPPEFTLGDVVEIKVIKRSGLYQFN